MKQYIGDGRAAAVRVLALAAFAAVSPAQASEASAPAAAPSSAPAGQGAISSTSSPSSPASGDAQVSSSGSGGWRVVPSISVHETYTDNVALTPSDRKESDFITNIAPSLRIEGKGARAKLSLDYRRQQLLYAGDSDRNSSQNFLNALGSLEAVERWLFVDAGSTITQQAISAFGAPTGTDNFNSNRSETLTYFISPYARGRIGSAAEYEARYRWNTTSSSSNSQYDSDVSSWTGVLKSSARGATFDWLFEANRQSSRTKELTATTGTPRSSELVRYRGFLIYHYDSDLALTLGGGHESNNYQSANTEREITYGAGFEWTPSPRTRASGLVEKRFFGDSHEFKLAHRTPLSSWQYSDVRTVTALPEQLALVPAGTAFDLLFNVLASRFPDPIVRAQEVERLLQQGGIPADLGLQRGFLTSRVFLDRIRQASVGFLGTRNTITFAAATSRREALTTGGPADDFSLSSVIDTRSLSASWAHKVTALSTVNLTASHIQTKGTAASNLETTQNTIRLLFSHQFSPRTSGGLSLRYVRFDGTTGFDYTEKAVTASMITTF